MIDFPAEQAELEFFPMPETRQSGRGAMLNVAVCETQVIRRYVDFCKQLGLDLQVIDIPELCLRNLAAQFPENERGVALLYLNDSHGILIIEKSAAIYVTRDLEVSSVQVEAALASEDDFQAGGIVDRLALEIQRSMDYYESYYGMPPIASLVVAPLATNTQVLVDQLNQRLGVMARAMDVSALLHCPNRLEDAVQQRCLPVLGALLREAEAA
jgi:MSHA biogenesis protein MshI